MLSTSDFALLPSDARLALIEARVDDRLADLGLDARHRLLDAVGDLALHLTRHSRGAWTDTRAAFTAALTAAGWGDAASDLLTDGVAHGLLVPCDGDRLRPLDAGVVHWCAARRVALAGPFAQAPRRFRGGLLDVVPMSVSLIADPLESQALGRWLVELEGPFEDALELASLQAALALAYGAHLSPELHGHVVKRAYTWTAPGAAPMHAWVGAAALATELRKGPYRDELQEGLSHRLDALVEGLRGVDVATKPELWACLDGTLVPLVAACEQREGGVQDLLERAPGHAGRIASAVSRVFAPGEATDRDLVLAARTATKQGDPTGMRALTALTELTPEARDLVYRVLDRARTAGEADPAAVSAAVAACEAVAQRASAEPEWAELLDPVLTGLVRDPGPPELRVAAARALSAHPELLAWSRDALLPSLEAELSASDTGRRAGAVGAALQLGSFNPVLPILAVGLVAQGVSPDVLGRPLGAALRRSPGIAESLLALGEELSDDGLADATLAILQPIAEATRAEREEGPFHADGPLAEEIRDGLVRMLMPLATDVSRELRCGRAANVVGWLGRRRPGIEEDLFEARARVTSDEMRGLLDLALGACGSARAETLEVLGLDAAFGAPTLAALAAIGLERAPEEASEIQLVPDLVDALGERMRAGGPHGDAIRQLMLTLHTLPG